MNLKKKILKGNSYLPGIKLRQTIRGGRKNRGPEAEVIAGKGIYMERRGRRERRGGQRKHTIKHP